MPLVKVGNIKQNSGGLVKVGNIYDKNFGVQNQNMQNAIAQSQQAQQQAQQDNSWQGMLKNTITGIPQAIGQTAVNTVQHPLDTLASIGSGVYRGAVKPLLDIQKYTNPAFYLPGAREKADQFSQALDYQPKNDTSLALKQGYEFAGSTVPYSIGGEIAGGTKLAQTAPRLANFLGWMGTSQALSDKKITDVEGRGKQALLDTLLFGLTGGLKKKFPPESKLEEVSPLQSQFQESGRVDIPSTKGEVRFDRSGNPYIANMGENPNIVKRVGKLETTGGTTAEVKVKPSGQIAGQQDLFGGVESGKKVNIKFKGSEKTSIPLTITRNASPKEAMKLQSEFNFQNWKDKSALSLSRETMERNLEDTAGKDAGKVKQFLIDPIRQNETARTNFVNSARKEIEANVIDKFGIKPGSKEDALIQRFGEGRIDLPTLQRKTKNWQGVVESANYFKEKYNQMLDMVNTERTKFGYEPIPKRQDYFRHYQEMGSAIGKVGMIFKQDQLPTSIAGITDMFKPGKPFSSAELQRKGGEFTESAIGGMDNYLDSISKQIFHLDSVQRGRQLENTIRTMAESNPDIHLNNLVSNINEYTNLLSGKKGIMDRVGERFLGRSTYGVINWLKQRTGANMIASNISSALTNFIPFTQSLATTSKPSALRGIMESMITPLKGSVADIDGQVSSFLTRRYPTEKLGQTLMEKAADKASILFRWVDEFSAKSVVAGKYFENIKKGIEPKQAMKLADEYAGKVLTDRSWGQLPVLFQQKTLGPITQFQAEVNNMYSFIKKDIPRQFQGNALKSVNALAQFVVYSYLYNNMAEKITGRRPTIDPIQAGLEIADQAPQTKGQPLGKRIVQASTDIAQNLPFTGILTGGGRLPISAGIPNPFAVASGESTWGKELAKPAYYLIPPFGGGQAKKTIEGLGAYNEGAVKNLSGNVQYPIEQNTPNLLRTGLFGKYSVPAANEYFANPHPLSDQQTELFKQLPADKQQEYYQFIQNNRDANQTKEEVHQKMREMVKKGMANKDNSLISEARKLDPAYFKYILQDINKEKSQSRLAPEQRMYQEIRKVKRGNPFYVP